MAYAGNHDFQNEGAPFLAIYNYRKRLAELGFQDSLKSLSAPMAEIFMIIGSEIQNCEKPATKK